MIEAICVLGTLGGLAALGLGAASRKFHVAKDPRVGLIAEALPGANCGGCGYAGCGALAQALVEGSAAPNACPPGGADVAKAVAEVLGVQVTVAARRIAVVHCKGSRDLAAMKGAYDGLADCQGAALVVGGPKLCPHGCLGLGSCAQACPFDAISVGEDGVARVDPVDCTGCGKCVDACPRRVLELQAATAPVRLRCNNPERAKAVKDVCFVGCVGCAKCEKICPVHAITMDESLPHIDPETCLSCGQCAAVCPTGAIDDAFAPRVQVRVQAATCIGCTKCERVCPVEAIRGERKQPHTVDTDACISCYRCLDVCPVAAVVKADPGGDGSGEEAA